MLDPTPRHQMFVNLLVRVRPVLYTSRQAADVYEIEVVGGIGPCAARIVDFEIQVWGCGGIEDGG